MTSEEGPVSMAEQEDNSVKMAGYLDKRGKMKLVSTWKRYWFVLKDQLLLYYKSQLECLNLSACRGSLNMGLASCVRPGPHRGPPTSGTQGYTIEVITRTQVITLRTKDRGLQEQWLKALLESMALPNISTPVRNSGGPMHFRYSMDNLPVVDELETEDKIKEKQKTLPHRTSTARHDSLLGRVKRLGGQSYGGSLDTILKRRPNNRVPQERSPQQPKIPRIKAVDRMLGLQQNEGQETEKVGSKEGQCFDGSENTTVPTNNNHSTGLANKDNDSTNLVSKECISKISTTVEIKYNDVTSQSKEMGVTKLKLENIAKVDDSSQETKGSVVSRRENQNSEQLKVMRPDESKECTSNFLENQKCVAFIENDDSILIENKLYEKTKTAEAKETAEVLSKIHEKIEIEEKDKVTIKNKVFEQELEKNKQYDSEVELCNIPQIHNVPEEEKVYEVVPVYIDGAIKSEKETKGAQNKEEEDYYYTRKYDKVSLMESLSDQCKSSSPEPDLPPRPSVCSNDSSKSQQQYQTIKTEEDEDADYEAYYETTGNYIANPSSPSQLLSSEDGSPTKKKKGLKLRGKIKLKKKKSTSKESVVSEDVNNGKKKRKMSFLRRVLKHYHKKPEANAEPLVTSDNHGSSDEPEYETVDYSVAMVKHKDTAEELPASTAGHDRSGSPEKEVQKEKLFGTKSLLTEQAMLELRMKLKGRDDATTETTSVIFLNEDIEGYEYVSSDDVPDRKPVPTPRPNKQKSNQDDKGPTTGPSRNKCNDGIIRANKPPSLPPRRVARPRSPWHDIPKNNSPIYGNFQDLGITVGEKKEDKVEKSPEPTAEKQSAPQAGEWDEELQDEFLGTPRGFVYIQNKWKAAEKSGEWSHDRQGNKGKPVHQKSPQKEKSPEKYSSTEELKMKQHKRSVSSESGGSSSVIREGELKSGTVHVVNSFNTDIYSDVNKQHLSAKTIIKCFNSQGEKNTNKTSELSRVSDEVCTKLNCAMDKMDEADNFELKFNDNNELKPTSTKVDNHDTFSDKTFNHNNENHINFVMHDKEHKFHTSETLVTLRKSQSDNETCNCRVMNGGSQNEHLPSSQLYNQRYTKEMKEENENRKDSTQETALLPNILHNQNRLTTEYVPERTVKCEETVEYDDIMPRLNRHSDELNLLLAQLAEITSAPLLPQGAATSLVDLPDHRKPKSQSDRPSQNSPVQPESFVLGPIRRRRHSDPDYDVPRPHGSLLHLLAPGRTSNRSSQGHSGQESDVIEATRFFGDADLTSNSARSSISLRHSVISEVDDQSDTSYYVSMAPDSLEVPPVKDTEESM